MRDWAVGESSTVCPEPANEATNPVYVNPVSAMICTDGMTRSLQVREEWSGTIPIARRDWFRFSNLRLFPIGAFTPRSACPHHGPIRTGSDFCCMVCSQSGVDDHPALMRDPRTDPRPERKEAALVRVAGVRETRKQRRHRLNAARQAGHSMAAVSTKDPVRPPSRPLIQYQ